MSFNRVNEVVATFDAPFGGGIKQMCRVTAADTLISVIKGFFFGTGNIFLF